MDTKELKRKIGKREAPHCSFCGRSAKEGVDIIVGPMGSAICQECAREAVTTLQTNSQFQADEDGGIAEKGRKAEVRMPTKIPTPRELVAKLDEYIVGQNEVKKTIATAVYNHYARLQSSGDGAEESDELKDVTIEKSNILLIGPTGCGKTLLAKTIAKVLNVPFAIADATTLTEAGYVGEDVENVIRYAYNNANGDIEATQRAVIFVDEIDKIASKTQNVSITRDVSGEGVQQALLKIIEGTICRFPPKGGRKHPDQSYIEVDTSNILFICSGAFVGLDDIVCGNRRRTRAIGFDSVGEKRNGDNSQVRRVRPEDLVEFGLIPEFVGRLPIIAEMKELTEDELVKVLTEPKNSLTKQYRKLLLHNGIEVSYDNKALRQLARRAIERNTGARGLRAEMEEVMKEIMFSAPENKGRKALVITEEMVKHAA